MVSCTIVIPTHNRGELLVRAVQSALKACPDGGEVLVVDDKSAIPAAQFLAELGDQRLRVGIHPDMPGAAGARNWGVSQARGEIIFFLDDDDEMLSDYCVRVLESAVAKRAAAWGFASTIERTGSEVLTDRVRSRPRLQRGVVSASGPLRDRVAAVSDGLWVRRKAFQDLGGFDRLQVIDEDTDLCLRLLGSIGSPWYEAEPGTVVYRGYVSASQLGAQLTVATAVQTGLACYQRTYERNATRFRPLSRERWFLCTRFLRRAAKQGQAEVAWRFVRSLEPVSLRLAAAAYLGAKLLVHGLRK